ncbi:tektin-4 [Ischnura elegans]|uniref:tektin-4 n=1 Tax=Ischnura elegans TaxID=197161 RepID=UPI001ED8ADA3|nr:tektin-4 [Ischnura elegans]
MPDRNVNAVGGDLKVGAEECEVDRGGQGSRPPHLPQPGDENAHLAKLNPEACVEQQMGPLGPWATGRCNWSPLADLTGTRPVVDRYTISRYDPVEWRMKNHEALNDSCRGDHRAKMDEFAGRACIKEACNLTDGSQAESTGRLAARAAELGGMKIRVEHAEAGMREEMELLERQRARVVTAMGVLEIPEQIVGECLELRTGRLEDDLVRDAPEVELEKELSLIREVNLLMQRLVKQAEDQQDINKMAKQRIELDWSDKAEAHMIDSEAKALRNHSTNILKYPGACRPPQGQSTPEGWKHFSEETLSHAEKERMASAELRRLIDVLLTDASRDLRTQKDAVDVALADRINETELCRKQLEDHLQETLRKIGDMERLSADLRKCIRNHDYPLKVAQTRLHNRLGRPNVESCRDKPQYGLIDEVKKIEDSLTALRARLQNSEDTLTELKAVRARLENQILVKRKTLSIDKGRCQIIRSHYPSTAELTGY